MGNGDDIPQNVKPNITEASGTSGEKKIKNPSPGQADRDESAENGEGADGDVFRPSTAAAIDHGNSQW